MCVEKRYANSPARRGIEKKNRLNVVAGKSVSCDGPSDDESHASCQVSELGTDEQNIVDQEYELEEVHEEVEYVAPTCLGDFRE
ncbi:hypothetical protein NQ314_005958 [Rhamnusium bicolor]|uniref:Uncharacterized protein n=1 Tax=Rhamnusium bicolor TaxID=1586634 RepID=A0AAV8ZD75_9CUCU|nr:hypothetical protein NQ314_005958 [Rhamnusium bicolor]